MPETLNEERYEEEWEVVIAQTKARYTLSKKQALFLKEAIVRGEKAVVFGTFTIFIPYILEFYRKRRFLKEEYHLPSQTQEKPYQPISQERWEKLKTEIYQKVGKPVPKNEETD